MSPFGRPPSPLSAWRTLWTAPKGLRFCRNKIFYFPRMDGFLWTFGPGLPKFPWMAGFLWTFGPMWIDFFGTASNEFKKLGTFHLEDFDDPNNPDDPDEVRGLLSLVNISLFSKVPRGFTLDPPRPKPHVLFELLDLNKFPKRFPRKR